MTNTPDPKELGLVKAQVTKAVSAAQAIEIKTHEDIAQATDVLSRIKTVGKMIKDRKEAITKPLNDALKSARALFAPLEESYEEAERIVKSKMIAYQNEIDRKAQEEAAKIAKKLEDGKISEATAMKKIDALPEAPMTVQGNKGAIKTSKVKKFEVIDKSKLPIEFLLPDEVAIRKAMHAGQELPGVKYWEENQISGFSAGL